MSAEKDYEILPEDYPNYDLSFKLIVIGNSGKKIIITNHFITLYRSRKIMPVYTSH